jgi:hypothetical protein
MKDLQDLIDLEQSITNNTFEIKKSLWGGAGQSVFLPSPEISPKPGIIVHEDAYAISSLLFALKEIIPYNYLDKFELFELLLVDLPAKDACLEIMKRAKIIYVSRTGSGFSLCK